jgi:hypothetical protein
MLRTLFLIIYKSKYMKAKYNYIVTAQRWGKNENHSYNLGVFSKKHKAIEVAENHTKYRGAKYACIVEECEIDNYSNDKDNYTKEVFRTKSAWCENRQSCPKCKSNEYYFDAFLDKDFCRKCKHIGK